MLQTEGRGRFCGVTLHVWNPRGGWWGEGDEKFFVDGEKFPSTFGTGSEDYFGYAWCNPHLFQRPYHCPDDDRRTTGAPVGAALAHRRQRAVSEVVRGLHREVLQQRHAARSMPSSPYWYLSPEGHDPYEPVPADQRDGYCVMPELAQWQASRCSTDPRATVSGAGHGGVRPWQVDEQRATLVDRRQTGRQAGTWPGRCEKAGRYEVSVVLTKARDYAIVQLDLDGKKAGEPIDLYNPHGDAQRADLRWGPRAYQAEHKLTVEIVGAV